MADLNIKDLFPFGVEDPENYKEKIAAENYAYLSGFIGKDFVPRGELMPILEVIQEALQSKVSIQNAFTPKVPPIDSPNAQLLKSLRESNIQQFGSSSTGDPLKSIEKLELQEELPTPKAVSFGHQVLQQTRLDFKPKEVDPEVSKQIALIQALIKGYENFLLDAASRLNEDAMDALTFSTLISMGIAFETTYTVVQGSSALQTFAPVVQNDIKVESAYTNQFLNDMPTPFANWYRNTPNPIGNYCLAIDSLIETENGKKPIQDLSVGDRVWAWNDKDKEFVLSPVTFSFKGDSDDIYKIIIGTPEISLLFCTRNHPILTKDNNYLSIQEGLSIEDKVAIRIDNGIDFYPILEIEKLPVPLNTFNIEVQTYSNFIANGVVVHNAGTGQYGGPVKPPNWWPDNTGTNPSPTTSGQVPDWALKDTAAESTSRERDATLGDGFNNQPINNSWVAVARAGDGEGGANFQEAAENLFADCIPCALRWQDLTGLDPLGDILNSIMNYLNNIVNQLLALYKMLFLDQEFMSDLCALLDFFNFQCIPDLMSLLMMLQAYIQQIIMGFYSLFNGGLPALVGLLGGLFIPLFGDLASILDQWIQMILAPIDCIIASLLNMTQKFGGARFTGVKEWAWKTWNFKEAYDFDEKTGEVFFLPQTQYTPEWQQAYIKENTELAEVELELENFKGVNTFSPQSQARITDLQAKRAKIIQRIKELESKKDPSVAEENRKRAYALSKALSSDPNLRKEARESGDLGFEGWLQLIQQITHKSLYFAASYILEARDSLNNLLDSLLEKFLGWLGMTDAAAGLKVRGLEKLKKIGRLIMIIVAIIDIIRAGKLKCNTDEDIPSEYMIQDAMFTLFAKQSGWKDLVDNSDNDPLQPKLKTKIITISDPETGEDTGILVTPPGLDPLTGGPQDMNVGQVTLLETQLKDVKVGNVIMFNGCIKTSKADAEKLNGFLKDLMDKKIALGI